MFSSPLWVRGYAPETPLLLFTGVYLSFFLQKEISLIIKHPFILFFLFFMAFLSPLHKCAKDSTRPPVFGSNTPTLLRRFPAKAGTPGLLFYRGLLSPRTAGRGGGLWRCFSQR
ncbi:hypothetical protein BREVNS_0477 [Brevinematales bacterium NS]|nr:hypothetical protein BREVNS_0477 [Brevinematales bacterium NS]